MNWQEIITLGIVAAAAGWLLFRFIRNQKTTGCEKGCANHDHTVLNKRNH